jgi:hypothetical protein
MEALLLPELLFAGFHVGNMALKPLVKLDAEFGFELLRIGSRTNPSDDIEVIAPSSFEAG